MDMVLTTGGDVGLENPGRSMIFSERLLIELQAKWNLSFLLWNMCMHGAAHLKITGYLTSVKGLRALELRCNHLVRHEPLSGSVYSAALGRWVTRT